MKKRSVKIIAAMTACALILGGCGSVEDLFIKEKETVTESVPDDSSVVEEVIDPEEQARLDLLDSLEDVSIPTTTQTTRGDDSTSAVVPDEYGLSETNEDESEDDADLAIAGAWLSDDETRQVFISDDGFMQLAVPLDWQNLIGELTRDDEVNQSFTVQIGNLDQATFFMSNSESRRYSPFMSLDEYSSAIVAALYNSMTDSEEFSDAELLETVDITSEVEDFVIRKSTLTATYEGTPVVYFIYAVQGGYRYFQFNCWTSEGQRENVEPIFDEVVSRFYEL